MKRPFRGKTGRKRESKTKQHPEQEKHTRFSVLGWIAVFFTAYLAVSFAFYFLARRFPGTVYAFYTKYLYKILTFPYKAAASLFPFSVAEIILIAAILAVLAGFIFCMIKTVKRSREKHPRKARPFAVFALCLYSFACVLGGNFVWLGGMNYNSLSFKELGNYTVKESKKEVLADLCRYLGQKAGEARQLLPEDENGVITETRSLKEVLALSQNGYQKLEARYSFFTAYTVAPKPAIFSEIMCYEQISGIFPIVYTESLVNAKTPASAAPHTACHELAHQYGFMREDEANFIGFLACIGNEDPAYIYSGYYTAFSYAMSQLYSYDKDTWYDIAISVDPGIYRDIAYENEFWSSYEKKAEIIASVSQSVNNTYLQMNNIEDGTHSYGRMVDLLIAEYKDILN